MVCGIRDKRLQRHLLQEADLTFAKAMDMLQVAEAVEEDARRLETTAVGVAVNLEESPEVKGGESKADAFLISKPVVNKVNRPVRQQVVPQQQETERVD